MIKANEKGVDEWLVKKTSLDRQWVFICLLLIAWVFFCFFKMNGFFDYSAKYGIEWISCSEEYNRLLLIDGDYKTTWGMIDGNHSKGEQINFHFRNNRSFSKVSILNTTDDETKIMDIYVSADGENFEKCVYSINVSADETYEYILAKQYYGQYLRLEYINGITGSWPITEVILYE